MWCRILQKGVGIDPTQKHLYQRVRILPKSLYGKNILPEDAPHSFFWHYYGSSWHAGDAGFIGFVSDLDCEYCINFVTDRLPLLRQISSLESTATESFYSEVVSSSLAFVTSSGASGTKSYARLDTAKYLLILSKILRYHLP